MKKVGIIDDMKFQDRVLDSDEDTIVLFSATWSPESQQTAEALREVAQDYKDISFYKIDTGGINPTLTNNDNPHTRDTYDIRIFPTLMFFRKGKLAGTVIGQSDTQTLHQWITQTRAAPASKHLENQQIKPYLQTCYEQIESQIKDQIDLNINRAIKRKRTVSLGSSILHIGGAFMLAALKPETTYALMSAAIMTPELLNVYNQTVRKNELRERPRFKSMTVRTAFNLAGIAGGAFLMSAAVSAGGYPSLLAISGLGLGGFMLIAAASRILRDVGDFMTTDLDQMPAVSAHQEDRTSGHVKDQKAGDPGSVLKPRLKNDPR
jgi:thiol-disulfide isomerase/thioredoxin